jgi:hypothetical protein
MFVSPEPAGITCLEKSLEFQRERIADVKALPSDIGKFSKRMVDKRALIRRSLDAEGARQRKTSPFRNSSPFPFIHDQNIRNWFRGKLNRVPFAPVSSAIARETGARAALHECNEVPTAPFAR